MVNLLPLPPLSPTHVIHWLALLVIWDSSFARRREYVERTSRAFFDDPSDGLEVRPTLTFRCNKTVVADTWSPDRGGRIILRDGHEAHIATIRRGLTD